MYEHQSPSWSAITSSPHYISDRVLLQLLTALYNISLEIGGGEQWEIDVIVSGIILRNEPRVLELCAACFRRHGKVLLPDTRPVGTTCVHTYTYSSMFWFAD